MSRDLPDAVDLDGSDLRIAVVAARFNGDVVERLLDGAVERLAALGVRPDHVEVVRVPGAFELPLVCQRAAGRAAVDGVVALGVVIRGGTPHFDYVCQGATIGIEAAARATDTPIAFGVLTTDDHDQAMARAGGDHGNKGAEAVDALVETIHALRRVTAAPA